MRNAMEHVTLFCRDDPRFPTVRGVLRRGMTVEGLKQFVIAQVNLITRDLVTRGEATS